ncbi:MAG: hypothetical protein ACYS26_02845 [Planctomycetota bacterium]|jgi:hypothetical protein
MSEHAQERRKTANGIAIRARIVLRCSTGKDNIDVAEELGVRANPVFGEGVRVDSRISDDATGTAYLPQRP